MTKTLLLRDTRGTAIVEFALLAPLIFGCFLGVLQVGLAMQTHNALRSIASDTARYAVVEYQKDNELTDAALEAQAETIATSGAYVMDSSFTADVAPVTPSRVPGAIEKTITVTYTPPDVLPFIDWVSPQLSFTRPIFLLEP